VKIAEPQPFQVIASYPNPFNPSTTIEFSLNKPGNISLDIYNVTGQKIRELFTGNMPEGIHSVVWDGLDGNGVVVSSGMYLYHLRMGEQMTAGRMTLIR